MPVMMSGRILYGSYDEWTYYCMPVMMSGRIIVCQL